MQIKLNCSCIYIAGLSIIIIEALMSTSCPLVLFRVRNRKPETETVMEYVTIVFQYLAMASLSFTEMLP